MRLVFRIPYLALVLQVSPLQALPATFSEGLYPLQHAGKWGYIDTSGKVVIPFIWDEVDLFRGFRGGIALVKKGTMWGVINRHCGLVSPPVWQDMDYADPDGKTGLLKVAKEGKWGLIDFQGKVVAEPAWDEIRGFEGGVSPVRSGGKDRVELSKMGQARTLEDYGRWGFIDTGGRVVATPDRWREVHNFTNGRFTVVEGGTIRKPVYKSVKYADGKMIADQAYDEAKREEDRQVKSKLEALGFDVSWNFEGLRSFKKEGRTGVVDSAGQVLVPAEWDEVFLPAVDGRITVLRDKKFGFYDMSGKLVIPAEWEGLGGGRVWFRDDFAIVRRDAKMGVINKSGEVVIPIEWDDVGAFSCFGDHEFASVSRNGKWGLVDRENRFIVKPVWDFCYPKFTDGLLLVRRDDKFGFIDGKEELVIPLGGPELGDYLIHERDWHDLDGRKTRAPVLRTDKGKVTFLINGKEVPFPIDKLIGADQALLKLATQ
jgi:hypothetical protein